MKDNITSREDIFLAKIAGKDVNIKTMTPPVATNMTEKLMLDIAERIDNIEAGSGGGDDEYEAVAEIDVGTMEQPQEMPGFYVYSESDASTPTLVNDETYYFNDSETSSTLVDVGVETVTLRFNANTGEGLPTRVNPNEPLYVIQWNIDNGTLLVISDANEAENTTVKILKKVSGSDEDTNTIFVNATANIITQEFITVSMTLAEVVAAAKAGKHVVFRIAAEIEGVMSAYAVLPAMDVHEFVENGDTVQSASFSMQTMDGVIIVTADSDDDDGAWTLHQLSSDNDYIVTFTAVTLDGQIASIDADKDISDIIEARNAGKRVIGRFSDSFEQEFALTSWSSDLIEGEGEIKVGFACVFPDTGTNKTKLCSVLGTAGIIEGAENDQWEYYE